MSPHMDAKSSSLEPAWMAEIERQFRERDPSVFFVLPRIVRRVLRTELEITSPWVRVPHRKSYVIARERLLWLVAADELGIESSAQVPDRALLLARPEDDHIGRFDALSLARYYWRLAFHAKIDAVMLERTSARSMSVAQLRSRIDHLGQEQFDEVRAVLKREGFLTHPEEPRRVYAEFVAVFAELRAFAPELVTVYFPSLVDPVAIEQLIREDCDTARLLAGTRPHQLELPCIAPASGPNLNDSMAEALAIEQAAPGQTPSRWRYRWAMRSADRLNAQGNTMRAAMLRRRAQRYAPLVSLAENEALLEADLAAFARRLQAALELDDAETERWRLMCGQLLTQASQGFWNANARLLYDLQKVCVDHERELYRVDLARWLGTLGRSPLRRPLTDLRLVLIAKHLRSADRRIGAVRISPTLRRELRVLLHRAAERAEELLQRLLEPQITESLHQVGMTPQNVIERAAFRKLTAELIDGVVERGFLTLGHLRDSISRGQLKLPDLTSAREFAAGDVLLRADRRLAATLDGVYQRGPFYLRWMQRMTSLFFGTPLGRLVTQYLALPFGGAFVALKGLEFLSEEVTHALHMERLHLYSHSAMFALGVLLLCVIHWPAFRQGVWLILRSTWILVRGLVIDAPLFLYRLPGVAWFLRSLPALLFRRYLLSPLAVTLLLWKGFPLLGLYNELDPWVAVATLVVSFLALNSRVGRDSEELLWEWLGRVWHRFRVNIVIGLFNLIIDVFRQIMDALERVLYSVDEWLRFRTGESHVSLALKAVLGLFWGFVQGIIRFCVTLLIEPQLNPIKHFPVVTVSHKLILPSVFYISQPFEAFTDPITAKAIGTTIVSCIPGVFGFLAWELKENWRIYAANRSPTLQPVLVGHHGETVLRLLTPGFHSGTVPKLFAKRRRAARKSQQNPDLSRHTKFDEKLHHEAVAVQHFVDREFLELLRQSRRLRDVPLFLAGVDLSTNRISVRIGQKNSDSVMRIAFAEQSGWLIAGMQEPGWLRDLTFDQQQVVSAALAGLYHFAAVDLVREHIEQQLGAPAYPYDVAETGLIVWPTRSYDAEVNYNLLERPTIVPRPRSIARTAHLDALPANALIFREHPIAWPAWRAFWEAEQVGEQVPPPLLPDVVLLRL
ncbi:MAG: hypothetical protein SFV23_03370 [Planctomycetaceae bacterium]|nr:hypothetical protein [Planctomycetaceae bacterium]